MHLKSRYCDLIYSSTSFLATTEIILGQKSSEDMRWIFYSLCQLRLDRSKIFSSAVVLKNGLEGGTIWRLFSALGTVQLILVTF